jgi:hypothetical protein
VEWNIIFQSRKCNLVIGYQWRSRRHRHEYIVGWRKYRRFAKTSWNAVYTVDWPEVGSAGLTFNAVSSGLGGSSTTSSLSVSSTDTNTLWIKPVFTGNTDTQYMLSIYNGATLVATEAGIGPSRNSIEIRSTPYTMTHRKSSFTPASLVMTGTANQTTFGINPGPETCYWQMTVGTGVDSVTAPNGFTYGATMA